MDRGVLPGLRLDPLRANAGRPGHRVRPELHEQPAAGRPILVSPADSRIAVERGRPGGFRASRRSRRESGADAHGSSPRPCLACVSSRGDPARRTRGRQHPPRPRPATTALAAAADRTGRPGPVPPDARTAANLARWATVGIAATAAAALITPAGSASPPPLALDTRPRRHQPRPRRLARPARRPRRLRRHQPAQRTTPHPGRPHHHHLPAPAAAAVTRLALAEERASYAARPTASQHLRHDGTTARRGLAATARRTTRWRATLFPASSWRHGAPALTGKRPAGRSARRGAQYGGVGRYILRSPSCRRRHRSSIRSIIRARLDCPAERPGPGRACPFVFALARAGFAARTLATCRRQLTIAHNRDSSRIAAPAALKVHMVGDHAGRDEATTDDDADESLCQLALIVHPRVTGAHETPELRILPVERLLDLLKLALLVFRERHDASHKKPCARQVCGDLSPHIPGSISRIRALTRRLEGWTP